MKSVFEHTWASDSQFVVWHTVITQVVSRRMTTAVYSTTDTGTQWFWAVLCTNEQNDKQNNRINLQTLSDILKTSDENYRQCRMLLQAPRCQHPSVDLLKDLRWLLVHGRVDYKIAVLCYKAVKLQQHSYITGLLSPYRQSRVLRTSTSDLLSTQSSSTNMAARRFSRCASTVWNSLPLFVRTADSFTSLRSQLKTYMFTRHL